MRSFTADFALSPLAFADFKFHSVSQVFGVSPAKRRAQKLQKRVSLNLVAVGDSRALSDFSCFRKRYKLGGFYGVVRSCKGSESEGDFELEAEILKFMKNSKNPEAFPSKKELIDSGRMDLVEKIMNKGGWLCLGWDLDEKEKKSQDNGFSNWDLTINNMENTGKERSASDGDGFRCSEIDSSSHSSQPASSSGRSLEMPLNEASGVEAILNRLEKERNMTLGFDLKDVSLNQHNTNKDSCWHW